MVSLLLWLLLAAPIPAICYLAYQCVTTWHSARQTLWAMALTGLAGGYTVLLFMLAMLAGFGILSSVFLLKNPAGAQSVLGRTINVLAWGSVIFACVTLLGLVLLIYSLLSTGWRQAHRAR